MATTATRTLLGVAAVCPALGAQVSSAFRGAPARARASVRLDGRELLSPGVVLVAKDDQFDHFYHEAVVFLHVHSPEGSRGVLLNRETPFLMGEMAEGMGCFAQNPVFRGGGGGTDTVLMFHDQPFVQGSKPIGQSGIFAGGLAHAQACISEGKCDASCFKFFFNQEVWAPGELERQLERDVWWVLADVPAAEILTELGTQSPLWRKFRRRCGSPVPDES